MKTIPTQCQRETCILDKKGDAIKNKLVYRKDDDVWWCRRGEHVVTTEELITWRDIDCVWRDENGEHNTCHNKECPTYAFNMSYQGCKGCTFREPITKNNQQTLIEISTVRRRDDGC